MSHFINGHACRPCAGVVDAVFVATATTTTTVTATATQTALNEI